MTSQSTTSQGTTAPTAPANASLATHHHPPPQAAPPAAKSAPVPAPPGLIPPKPEASPSAQDREKAVYEQLQRAEQAMIGKRLGEAAGICQDVLEAVPDYPPALALLGSVLGNRGDVGRAIPLLERAVAKQPNVAAWHSNLSGLYRLLYRFQDAVAAATQAVRLQPAVPRFQVNLGKALMDRGEREAAVNAFLAALAKEPGHAEAHLAIGQILLARGEMKPGWVEYEWRNQLDQARGMLPKMAAPAWNGMRMPEDRILLVGDQGYGDTLQFCRYIPEVAARCREVVVGCSPDIEALIRTVRGVSGCFTRWDQIPAHKVFCLLSSLPGIFGTELTTVPASIPYVSADPALISAWQTRFARDLPQDALRVGIAWAGRTTHPNDRRRSMRLADLAPLAEVPGVAFVSLQQKFPARDRAAPSPLPNLLDVGDQLTNFAETAAAIVNLDLVVCVDTSIGHLAGALGKPAWLMLATPSDWRWLLDRADSPWYPTHRLFRQPQAGDWTSVTTAIAEAIARHPRRGKQAAAT